MCVPQSLVSASVQVDPLLLRPSTPESSIGLIPNIPNKSILHSIGLDVADQLVQEVVIVGKVPIVTRPYGRRIGMVCSPDIMWQDNEVATIFSGSLIVLKSRLKSALVLIETPNPSSARSIELSTACTAVVEADVLVEMVWNLIWICWRVRNTVNESRSQMFRGPSID